MNHHKAKWNQPETERKNSKCQYMNAKSSTSGGDYRGIPTYFLISHGFKIFDWVL